MMQCMAPAALMMFSHGTWMMVVPGMAACHAASAVALEGETVALV